MPQQSTRTRRAHRRCRSNPLDDECCLNAVARSLRCPSPLPSFASRSRAHSRPLPVRVALAPLASRCRLPRSPSFPLSFGRRRGCPARTRSALAARLSARVRLARSFLAPGFRAGFSGGVSLARSARAHSRLFFFPARSSLALRRAAVRRSLGPSLASPSSSAPPVLAASRCSRLGCGGGLLVPLAAALACRRLLAALRRLASSLLLVGLRPFSAVARLRASPGLSGKNKNKTNGNTTASPAPFRAGSWFGPKKKQQQARTATNSTHLDPRHHPKKANHQVNSPKSKRGGLSPATYFLPGQRPAAAIPACPTKKAGENQTERGARTPPNAANRNARPQHASASSTKGILSGRKSKPTPSAVPEPVQIQTARESTPRSAASASPPHSTAATKCSTSS